MSRIRFVLNKEGVSELLKSGEMAAICNAEAQAMTTATGTEWKGYTAATRVVVTNKESKHQHAPNHKHKHKNEHNHGAKNG